MKPIVLTVAEYNQFPACIRRARPDGGKEVFVDGQWREVKWARKPAIVRSKLRDL
jgi:hypothetical protein